MLRHISSRAFSSAVMRPRRALMYIPGSSEKMLQKSIGLDLDTVCFDLEDGVASSAKDAARSNIPQFLASSKGSFNTQRTERVVRINPVGESLWKDDIRAVMSGSVLPDGFVIPKVDHVEQLTQAEALILELGHGKEGIDDLIFIGMIETGISVLNLREICQATPRLKALIFGADDYAASIGATRTESNDEIQFARNWTLLHAKTYGLQCIDMVHKNFKPEHMSSLQEECKTGNLMGYTGKQVIHPAQIHPVQQAFRPAYDRVQWAKRVIDATEQHAAEGVGAFDLDGMMIDEPTVKIARNIANLHDTIESIQHKMEE